MNFLLQVVIVPCGLTASLAEEKSKSVINACDELMKELKAANIRAKVDARENYSPGWKFYHWEQKVGSYFEYSGTILNSLVNLLVVCIVDISRAMFASEIFEVGDKPLKIKFKNSFHDFISWLTKPPKDTFGISIFQHSFSIL